MLMTVLLVISAREEEARAPRAAVHRATKPVSRKTSRS